MNKTNGQLFLCCTVTVLLMGALCNNCLASDRIVGKPNTGCAHAQYSTITNAIEASAPGDVIRVCPGLYDEQLVITKPLTIRGLNVNQRDRVQIQPSAPSPESGTLAVVTVQNTNNVYLKNLAVDASNNTVSGCTPTLAGVHFLNASGELENDAISGAKITNLSGCATGPAGGNGFGVLAESTASGDFRVEVENSSIHDYSKEGVRAIGSALTADVHSNIISGFGPGGGFSLQFGVLVLNGALGLIKGNQITEGDCGSLSASDCVNARSEGVTLRAVADGTVVENNVITRAQSGIFVNFATHARISHNLIANINGVDGIDAQGMSHSVLEGNSISDATPLADTSCGIAEFPGPGQAGGVEGNNRIVNTYVNDAWCGVVYDPTTDIDSGHYHNVVFTQFRNDVGPPAGP